jgi:hypothetical protein
VNTNRRHHLATWGAALLSVAAAGWWTLRRSPLVEHRPGPASPATKTAAASATPQIELTSDGVPIRPAGSTSAETRGMVPHPLTPQHARIFRENNLIGDLNGAMDAADAPALRRLLAVYRDEFPEDAHTLQDGYELIASCLENLTPETRATAQRYYDQQLDSGLRRYIRRHCLEATTH